MLSFYFHLGAAKAASSSIQNMLLLNREHLEAVGVYYPDEQNYYYKALRNEHTPGNAKEIAFMLIKGEKEKLIQLFKRHINDAKSLGCEKICYSHEGLLRQFSYTDRRKLLLQVLKEAAGDFHIYGLAVLRNPVSLGLALFKQQGRTGKGKSYMSFRKTYEYQSYIDNLVILKNQIQLTFIQFEKDIKNLPNVLKEWLGIDGVEFKSAKTNWSLPMAYVLTLQKLGSIFPFLANKLSKRVVEARIKKLDPCLEVETYYRNNFRNYHRQGFENSVSIIKEHTGIDYEFIFSEAESSGQKMGFKTHLQVLKSLWKPSVQVKA